VRFLLHEAVDRLRVVVHALVEAAIEHDGFGQPDGADRDVAFFVAGDDGRRDRCRRRVGKRIPGHSLLGGGGRDRRDQDQGTE
jgi:hypothetical protein